LFNRLADLNKTGWERVTGMNRDVVPFPCAAMGLGTSSLSFAGTALPTSVLEGEGMGRERGGCGDSTLATLGMGNVVVYSGRSSHGHDGRTLVESSPWAGRGAVANWGRERKVWRSSLSSQSSCDGRTPEIDEGLSSVQNRGEK